MQDMGYPCAGASTGRRSEPLILFFDFGFLRDTSVNIVNEFPD